MYYGGLGVHMQQMSVHKRHPRAVVSILESEWVKRAVLCESEQRIGDSAWRTGNEYLLFELAKANVETLNELSPKRIVTKCPYCLYTINNEYPLLIWEFDVIHLTPYNFRINRR